MKQLENGKESKQHQIVRKSDDIVAIRSNRKQEKREKNKIKIKTRPKWKISFVPKCVLQVK